MPDDDVLISGCGHSAEQLAQRLEDLARWVRERPPVRADVRLENELVEVEPAPGGWRQYAPTGGREVAVTIEWRGGSAAGDVG